MGEAGIEYADRTVNPVRHLRATNWKGGRVVASNGYVLLKLAGHHLADVRGYVYEHRLVAEQKLGRLLLPAEITHHVNGVKDDNRPENIEVVASVAHHRVHHRKAGRGLRMPDEPNITIGCACGCGGAFPKYDESGRPRAFIIGHNPQAAPTEAKVLAALADGPIPRALIVARSGLSGSVVGTTLWKLQHKGLVVRASRGMWQRP